MGLVARTRMTECDGNETGKCICHCDSIYFWDVVNSLLSGTGREHEILKIGSKIHV